MTKILKKIITFISGDRNKIQSAEDDMGYKAIDVARYIVNKFYTSEYKEKGYSISNMKLQKILYLVQAYFLVENDRPCFSEKIHAWSFGPVVPAAYHEFKCYGNLPIPEIKSYLIPDSDGILGVRRIPYECRISESDKKDIDKIVDIFKDWSAIGLMKYTHTQKPWIDAYADGHSQNDVIENEAIADYFTNILEDDK